jgi:hypothetical protein
MSSSVRAWDLESGQARPLHGKEKPRDLVLAKSLDPFMVEPAEIGGGTVVAKASFDVWGFDPRVCVLVQQFYRRSRWFAQELGHYSDEEQAAAAVVGSGMSFDVKVIPLTTDVDGIEHTLGELDSSIWLGDGSGQGGVEITSAALGMRFEYTVSWPYQTDEQACSTWDLCAQVLVKPNGRLGCGDVVEEIVNGLYLVKSGVPIERVSNWGGL